VQECWLSRLDAATFAMGAHGGLAMPARSLTLERSAAARQGRGHLSMPSEVHTAVLIGSSDEVTEKIVRYGEVLGGISRISFQMNAASLPHAMLMKAIETIGTRIAPLVRDA
jgi:hypothetical protein